MTLRPTKTVFDASFLREMNDIYGGALTTPQVTSAERAPESEPLKPRGGQLFDNVFLRELDDIYEGGLSDIGFDLPKPQLQEPLPTGPGFVAGEFFRNLGRDVEFGDPGVPEEGAPLIAAETTKEFLRRSIVPLAKAGATGIQAVGGLLDFLSPLAPGLGGLFFPEFARKGRERAAKAGRAVTEFGKESAEILREISPVENFVIRKEGKLRPNVEALKNPETWTDAIITTIGSISQAIAIGGGSPVAASVAGGVLEAGPMFNDLIESGMNRVEASARALAFGAIVGGLNKISFDKFLKGAPGLKNAFITAATEAWTEAAEEPWQAILSNLGRKGITLTEFGESLSDSLANAFNVVIPALFGGFIASAGGNVQAPFQAEQVAQPPPLPEQPLQAPPAQVEQVAEPAPVQTPSELAPVAEGAAIPEPRIEGAGTLQQESARIAPLVVEGQATLQELQLFINAQGIGQFRVIQIDPTRRGAPEGSITHKALNQFGAPIDVAILKVPGVGGRAATGILTGGAGGVAAAGTALAPVPELTATTPQVVIPFTPDEEDKLRELLGQQITEPTIEREEVPDDDIERERISREEQEREELRRAVPEPTPSPEEVEAGRVLQAQEPVTEVRQKTLGEEAPKFFTKTRSVKKKLAEKQAYKKWIEGKRTTALGITDEILNYDIETGEYTVRDVETGEERIHRTFIHPSNVLQPDAELVQAPPAVPKPTEPGAPVSPQTETYYAGVPAENVVRDIDTIIGKLSKTIPKATDPLTPKQRRQIISQQRKMKLGDEFYQRAVSEVSKGRTESFEELNKGEAAAYMEYLKRELGDIPDPRLMKEPVLQQFAEELETEMLQARKDPARVLTKGEQLSRQFFDIDRVMSDLQEESGLPFFEKHNLVNRAYRDAKYDAGEDVKRLFEGTGVDFTFLANNKAAEKRIFDFLNTGVKADDMTSIEVKIANRMDIEFRKWRPLVKRIRHQRYMRDGTVPPDTNKTTMDEGTRVLTEQGEEAYAKWIEATKFGIREFYAPARGKKVPNLNAVLETKFGRGFAKERKAVPEYDEEHPLIGDFYRYVLRSRMIESVEPKLIELENLVKESGMEPGLMVRYFDNMYGRNFQNDLDIVQKTLMGGMRQFFRVRIPQQILKWSARNLMQPTAMTLPRVISPMDPLFWKNLPKLYTGALKMRKNTKAGWGKFLADEDTRNYFRRYVTSLDMARQHFLFQEMSEFETIRDMMHFMDTISKAYSWTDTVNRANAFVFGYETGLDALERFEKAPTRANWNKFLSITGSSLAPKTEQVAMARLVEEGNTKEAAYVAAKRLADASQFRYPRAERGLMWQRPGQGASIITPIATFWKGEVQGLYKDGVKPFVEGLRAEAEGTATSATRNRTSRAAVMMMSWYAASLMVNRLYEWMYDVDEGTYGLKSLRYTPGGPVLQNVIRFADTLWGAFRQEKGWTGKTLATIDSMGDLFLPFYHLLTRTIKTVRGEPTFKIPFAARRQLQEWLAKQSGTKNPRDQRRWVERTTVEQAQAIFLSGSWSTRKQDLLDSYEAYMAVPEDDPKKLEAARARLLEDLRKYPVSTKRKDIPRTLENIDELVPSFWDSLDKNAAK